MPGGAASPGRLAVARPRRGPRALADAAAWGRDRRQAWLGRVAQAGQPRLLRLEAIKPATAERYHQSAEQFELWAARSRQRLTRTVADDVVME
eukprot:7991951-Lingulodinium_polyedra.AAC.1